MTNQELKDLVASLAISQAETTEQMQESKKEADKRKEELDKQMQESKRKFDDMTQTLKNLGIHVDGISKTTGLETEEFFYSSFSKEKRLNNIKFDSITPNFTVEKDEATQEIDIFLENGDSVGIIEVKNKVKDKDLKQLQRIVDDFYLFHPSFKNYKIIPAIAGKVFPKHIQNKALKNGFIVITQVGNHIEQQNPKFI